MSIVTKWPDYEKFLRAIESMTEDDMRAAVAQLPPEILVSLARGPLSYRYDCGVCASFGGETFYGRDDHDPEDPLDRAWGYHEVIKLKMKRRDQAHYGGLANETYERCIATYRAAGWTGEAPEPNA